MDWLLLIGAVTALLHFGVRPLRATEPTLGEEMPQRLVDFMECPRCGRKTAAFEYHVRRCAGTSRPLKTSEHARGFKTPRKW